MHVHDELSESPGPSACVEHVQQQAVSVRSVVGTTRRDDTSARTARQIGSQRRLARSTSVFEVATKTYKTRVQASLLLQ
jgi:hypothetical protein